MKIYVFSGYLMFIWSILSILLAHQYASRFAYAELTHVLVNIVSFCLEICALYAILKTRITLLTQGRVSKCVTLWVIYSVYITCVFSSNVFYDMRTLLWWPSIYYLFLYLYSNARNEKILYCLTNKLPLYLFISNSFIFSYAIVSKLSSMHANNVLAFTVSNIVFYVVTLLPFAFIQKNTFIVKIWHRTTAILGVLSIKRSAIVAICLSFLYASSRNAAGARLLKTIIQFLFLISLFIGIDAATSNYITKRFSSALHDGGSGRTDIYSKVVDAFLQGDFTNQLFGHGYNGVVRNRVIARYGYDDKMQSLSAHNDFLEMLYDYGILGVTLYILICINIFKELLHIRTKAPGLLYSGVVALIIFITMSSVSHLFLYPTYIAYLMMIFSLIQAQHKNSYINQYLNSSTPL